METKLCTTCGFEKPIIAFYKQRRGRLGVNTTCKECKKNYRISHKKEIKEYREANKEKMAIYSKIYRKIHSKKITAIQKTHRENHKKEKALSNKLYYEKNKERLSIQNANYRKNHKKESIAYRKKNREKHNIWTKLRRKTNPKVRLCHAMSTAVQGSLLSRKNGRQWEKLVGYTADELKNHLESLFTEGMTWENNTKYGWHIDHKIPISVFNFTAPEHEDFKKCWALSNLQPMWAMANMAKGNKINKHFQPSLLIGG